MVVTAFWAGFVLTLVAAAAALVTGRTGRRRAHYASAVSAVVVLGFTIYFARRLTEARELPGPELEFHLIFAKSGAVLVLPVIATGLWMAWTKGRSRVARICHRSAVVLWLLVVLVATATGIWMYSLSTPLAN